MLVGRGRGHVSTDRREQLRRPVDPTYVSPLDAIATKIAALKGDAPAELEAVGLDISRHCASVDKLKLLISDLHERSLVNRKFGTKCAMALATQAQLTVDGKKMRTILMANIQTDFEDKENLRHHNMNRFLNTFAFIGEVLRHIRVADGSPIAVLAIALIEYCKLLITGTEPEVELCVQQLAYNGKLLKKWKPQLLAALQVLIRSSCMVPGTDARCLCWLHLACDLDRSNYDALSDELRELYETKLGQEAMALINELLLSPEPSLPDKEEEAIVASALNGVHIGPEKTPLAPDHKAKDHTGSGDSSMPDKPRFAPAREPRTPRNPAGEGDRSREQRAPGHRERRADPRNDPANWLPRQEMPEKDRAIWGRGGGRRGRGSYGHDDRFDREDDFYGSGGRGKADAHRSPPTPASVPSASTEESWD